jgi:leader peptidase (prepilin peptidase) / N-methyltransferase
MIAVYAGLVAALIACTFIDIDLRIIPDKIDLPGMALAPVLSAAFPGLHGYGDARGTPRYDDLATLGLTVENPHVAAVIASVLGIICGAGVIYVIGVLGSIAFRKEAMGFGDVKLLGMIGGYLGWKGVLLALLLGCFAGAAIGIIVNLVTKDPYIPFGPFLSVGALLVILWRGEIIWFLTVWWPGFVNGLVLASPR